MRLSDRTLIFGREWSLTFFAFRHFDNPFHVPLAIFTMNNNPFRFIGTDHTNVDPLSEPARRFRFVIAVFGVDNGLIDADLYASVVLAVLISTIIPPFLLRFTISYYNKKAEEAVKQAVMDEMNRKHDLESTVDEPDHNQVLEEGIRNKSTVFLCIQTQSESSWGLLHRLMGTLAKLELEVIDHRAWSPRGINTTLVNEIYAKDSLDFRSGDSAEQLNARIEEISNELNTTINQPDVAKVKVQRWYPGVVEEYGEEVDENNQRTRRQSLNLEQRLLEAATAELERKQAMQVSVTQEVRSRRLSRCGYMDRTCLA